MGLSGYFTYLRRRLKKVGDEVELIRSSYTGEGWFMVKVIFGLCVVSTGWRSPFEHRDP